MWLNDARSSFVKDDLPRSAGEQDAAPVMENSNRAGFFGYFDYHGDPISLDSACFAPSPCELR
jgi:hypothetical protein